MQFNPKVIFEIGVGELNVCRTREFWATNIECHCFEPHPRMYNELANATKFYPNVKTYNLGISDKEGNAELYLANNCSFIKGIDSPVALQDCTKDDVKNWDKTTIKLDTIDKFDKGNIDLLLLDMEGSEWFVLEKLISRPELIVIETHIPTSIPPYLNKYMNEILFWMWDNNYQVINKNETDSFFKRIG